MKKMTVAACVVLTACIQLTPAGKRVKYVEHDSGRFAKCERLPRTFLAADVGRREALSKLRNAVGAAGGTHVNLLETEIVIVVGLRAVQIQGEGYKCAEEVGGMGGETLEVSGATELSQESE